MQTAKQLFLEYLTSFPSPDKAAALFAPDGALEMPYLASINISTRAEGPKEIEKFISTLMTMLPDLKFSNPIIRMENDSQVFAEYEVHTTATHTNRPFNQLFFGWLTSDENGKIKILREAWNTIEAAKALLRDGIDDIPKF
jgi:hypothetical protein